MRSVLARDLTALSSVGGIGRKKAERLVLELQDKFGDVVLEPQRSTRRRARTRPCARSWAWATDPAPPTTRSAPCWPTARRRTLRT